MKGIALLIVVLGIWLAYKHHELPLPGARAARRRRRKQGVQSTMSRGFGSATSNLARSGNSSPGSGTQAQQPLLSSTWQTGGGYNIGGVAANWVN